LLKQWLLHLLVRIKGLVKSVTLLPRACFSHAGTVGHTRAVCISCDESAQLMLSMANISRLPVHPVVLLSASGYPSFFLVEHQTQSVSWLPSQDFGLLSHALPRQVHDGALGFC
jgi:hypothetical protein